MNKILKSSKTVDVHDTDKEVKELVRIQNAIYAEVKNMSGRSYVEDVCVKNDGKRISVWLLASLFREDTVSDINLDYNSSDSIEERLGIRAGCRLSIDVFSDRELTDAFIEYCAAHPKEGKFAGNTSYFFNEQGKFAKITRLPSGMDVKRKVIFDYGGVEKDYPSEMTKEDFLLAKRALTWISKRFQDYKEWRDVDIFL
mgnify:FL=1